MPNRLPRSQCLIDLFPILPRRRVDYKSAKLQLSFSVDACFWIVYAMRHGGSKKRTRVPEALVEAQVHHSCNTDIEQINEQMTADTSYSIAPTSKLVSQAQCPMFKPRNRRWFCTQPKAHPTYETIRILMRSCNCSQQVDDPLRTG